MCPQTLQAPFSRAHTSVSTGREVSAIPLECELMVAGEALRMSQIFAISLHTQSVPLTMLYVYFCESTSSLLPLSLYTLCPLHLKSPVLELILRDSLLRTPGDDVMLPHQLIPPTCHSLFLSLSPPLNCEGRLMSEYLFCSQHLVFNFLKKLLNGEMNT